MATIPDRSWITCPFPTHVIFSYHLPLSTFYPQMVYYWNQWADMAELWRRLTPADWGLSCQRPHWAAPAPGREGRPGAADASLARRPGRARGRQPAARTAGTAGAGERCCPRRTTQWLSCLETRTKILCMIKMYRNPPDGRHFGWNGSWCSKF